MEDEVVFDSLDLVFDWLEVAPLYLLEVVDDRLLIPLKSDILIIDASI